MTALLYGLIWLCAGVFIIACLVRAIRYARMPLHLRWELYPVPHEAAERAAHGGSYLEEGDWWTRPAHRNLIGEAVAMATEIVFLRGLWEFNRKLWLRSFPFHFGLYLVIASLATLFLATISGYTFGVVRAVYVTLGLAGAALVIIGSAALLARRLADPELRPYTTAGDVFNLAFFFVTFTLLAAGYLLPRDAGLSQIARGILTWDSSVPMPGVLGAGLVFGAVLAAYIPLTHMSHFIAKYFTYHSVRWDDQPLARRSGLEKRIAELLALRPTWSAPHLAADGKKTWAEVATSAPAQAVKK